MFGIGAGSVVGTMEPKSCGATEAVTEAARLRTSQSGPGRGSWCGPLKSASNGGAQVVAKSDNGIKGGAL